MTQPPRLSLLLPAFEVARYVPALITSLWPQLTQRDEVIFVDDASSDDTVDQIERRRADCPATLRCIRHTRNLGVAAARNTLLEAARGDWLWFVDPDDLVESGALAQVHRALDDHAPDWLTLDFRRVASHDDGTLIERDAHLPSFAGPASVRRTDRDALLRGLFAFGRWHPWSKIVRRRTWPTALRFPVGRVFEDLAVYPRLALHAQSHLHLATPCIAYRQRAGSVLARLDRAQVADWMAALDGYAAELDAAGVADPATRRVIATSIARQFVRACRRRGRLGAPGVASDRASYAAATARALPLAPAAVTRALLAGGRPDRALSFWWYWRHAMMAT